MALPGGSGHQGTKVAIAILLLWFAGGCLFISFLSGKTASMTTGTDQSGHAQGPADASELVTRLAENVQTLEGQGSTQDAGSSGTGSEESV